MEFRDSFSRLKKKVKHRLTGRKLNPENLGADIDGERVDSTGSSRSGSEPHIVAGGAHDQEGKEANTDGGLVLSTIQLPQQDELGSMPALENVNDQGRRGADVDKREAEQTYSHPPPYVEVAEGSGPAGGKDTDGEKVEQLHPSSSTTSAPHDGKSNST